MSCRAIVRGLLAAAIVASAVVAQAVVITDTVWVTNPGNANDDTGYGEVGYAYRMGKYEVTAGQYTEFLNAVAKTDTYGLYNSSMSSGTYCCNIQRSGASGSYVYSVAADWANRPANYVTWGDAARFANWLHNGQRVGAQDSTTTENGSYNLNGAMTTADLMAVIRSPNATYVIPTENEWYKAAYYDPHKTGGAGYWDYETGTNVGPAYTLGSPDSGNSATYSGWDGWDRLYTIGAPYYRTEVGAHANSASPYGTFDQGGNVFEFNETVLSTTSRGVRGGCFRSVNSDTPAWWLSVDARPEFGLDASYGVGFRVGIVPEPGSIVLVSVGAICLLGYAWRRRARTAG